MTGVPQRDGLATTPQRAHHDGDARSDQLHRIASVTDAELASLGVTELLDALLDRVRALLGADTAVVLLLDPARSHVVATAACGLDEEVRQGVRIPLGEGFAGRIAASREPVYLREVTGQNVVNPILLASGVRTLLGVPLIAGGDVLGVLHVGTLTPREFTPDDVALLQMVADRIALATRARLSRTDRTAAATLQRSLLPAALPTAPGVGFAARYVAGEGEIGGDWYDVFPHPDGRIWIVIGDVGGRGLEAAATMGRLRTLLRAFTLDLDDPARILEKVDRFIRQFEKGLFATAVCALLDPTRGELTVASGGHLLPVAAHAGTPAAELPVPLGPPLGLSGAAPRSSAAFQLRSDTTLCFYTDGLVERRGAPIDDGLDRLRRAMTVGNPDTVCATIMTELIGRYRSTDDVACLVCTYRPPDPRPTGDAAHPAPSGRSAER